MPLALEARWHNLDFRHLPQYLFRRANALITQLPNLELHHLGKDKSSTEPFVQILHALDRVHLVGEVREKSSVLDNYRYILIIKRLRVLLAKLGSERSERRTQMRDLWNLPAIAKWEKTAASLLANSVVSESERRKHPTQKPLPLLVRIILASTKENTWILDPFTGSSTTGIAASLLNRRFLGIEKETEFLEMSKHRREEIENPLLHNDFKKRIEKYSDKPFRDILEVHENAEYFGADLTF